MNQLTTTTKLKGKKKGGRRKINIEFIENKSRRHVTFSKRKAGLIKKAYELSTLTGTQVLLLVASETGNVYTFATPKLQPLITKPEGKTLIQACLNPPEVIELPHQQAPVTNIPHQQPRMPSESLVYSEKQKPPSTYQSKESAQNIWTPLQDRIIKDTKVVPSSPALSELSNFSSYNASTNSTNIASPQNYSQYNYGSSMGGYAMNGPRYQFPTSSTTYNQFTASNQQGGLYVTPNSTYMYPSPVGNSSPTSFTSSSDGSSLASKEPMG